MPNVYAEEKQHKILILGDSHLVGGFGDALHGKLAELKLFPVYSVAFCAATFDTFRKSNPKTHCGHRERTSDIASGIVTYTINTMGHSTAQSADYHLETFQPTILIAEIGMNYGPYDPSFVAESARSFAEFAKSKGILQFYIVGPPAYPKALRIENALREGLIQAQFGELISSIEFNKDKPMSMQALHFSIREAEKWGEMIFNKIFILLHLDQTTVVVKSK